MKTLQDGRTVITPPVTLKDIEELQLGDVFYYTGELTTGRDAVHERFVLKGEALPVDLKDGVLMHAGPIVREREDGTYEMVAIGPTTSMRMERFTFSFLEQSGVRILIGKGGMGDETTRACKTFGAIQCVFPAGNAVVAASAVEEVTALHWEDLGMPEALWTCRVRDFGPLIVTIDAHGNNFFADKGQTYRARMEAEAERFAKAWR